jgi:hypothetical protein
MSFREFTAVAVFVVAVAYVCAMWNLYRMERDFFRGKK